MTRNRSDAAPSANGTGRRRRDPDRAAAAPPPAEAVARYLRANPAFLTDHPELFASLTPPDRSSGDGVVDLQGVFLNRLRHQVESLTEAHAALLRTSRDNLAAQGRLHQAVLTLLSAASFEQLIETVTTDLPATLDLDTVVLAVERRGEALPPARLRGLTRLEPGAVDLILGEGRAILLRPDSDGDPAIYGPAAGLVRSDALIRLSISSRAPAALLALGARKPEQFHPGQGTALLGFLGQALERCIRGWLNLGP